MKIVHASSPHRNRLAAHLTAIALLFLLSLSARAQSTDIDYPTLVRTNEISGTITPRDVGDPRLTRYFYSFTGTPGDLIVTVESSNLEGDVDVFTAGTLRPLAKVSLYAGTQSSGGSKTIYLRNRESLILRVEARTPNETDGSFHVRFEGTFEPISSDIPDREPIVPTVSSASKDKNARRVTSTGARIEEPKPEVTEAKQPETPQPAPTETETPKPAETPSTPTTTEAAKAETPKPRTPRIRRPRTPTRTTRTRPATTARKTPPKAEQPAPSAPTVEPASGPRLIIEMRDGMKVERFMTTVRRVTVENGQIVVVTKDGKVEREPMSNVLRMAIEP
jgi:hypothetical protein